MSRFLGIRNKLICKENIAYIAYNNGEIEDCESELYDIVIVTKYGDNIKISHLNKESFTDDLDYIEAKCTYSYGCDLYLITPGIYINLYLVSYLEFYNFEDNGNNRYAAIIKWDIPNTDLPETFLLDNEFEYDKELIENIIESIEERS